MSKLKKVRLLAFIMFYMVTLGVLCFDTQAYAATSGTIPCTSGDVSWTIDDNGVLTFRGSGTTNISPSWSEYWESAGLDKTAVTSVEVENGANIVLNTADSMFNKFKNCTAISLTGVNTGFVTDMSGMFYECQSLTSLDLSGFNTSNVVDMRFMFFNCYALESLDISSFDTSKVTDMTWMFVDCFKLSTLDLSHFNTNNVTQMAYMFGYCESLKTLNISNFNTTKTTEIIGLFQGCESLESLDVSNFDTSNITNMDWMFSDCKSLVELDLSNWNTSKVTSMIGFFENCESLSKLDISNFDTSKVTDMSRMFYNCAALKKLDVSSFETNKVTYMRGMFTLCQSLEELDVSNFNTSNVEDMRAIFGGCSSLKELDLSNWNTSKITKMGRYDNFVGDNEYGMFSDCKSLTKLDISNFDTSNVTNMEQLFVNCESLTDLDISNFDTSKVTDMSAMFYNCKHLKSLDLSNFNTSSVTSMSSMFYECQSLSKLDISNFKTDNVTDMGYMFYNCKSLLSVDVSNFKTDNVTDMGYMFYNCQSLTKLDLSSFDTSKVKDLSHTFYYCHSLKTLDLSSFDTTLSNENGHTLYIYGKNLEKFVAPKTAFRMLIECGYEKIIYDNKGNFYGSRLLGDCEPLTEFYIVPTIYSINYVYEGELVDCPDKYNVKGGCSDLGYVVAEHYTFGGWYTDSTYQTKVTEIKKHTIGDITLYAKMIPKNYGITYENVEPAISLDALPIEYSYGVGIELPDIESECYSFAGWYEDVELTKKITAISKTVSGTVTVYAKWTPVHKIEVQNAKEATCQEKGYTGDEYCLDCDKKTLIGREIPPVAHDNSVVKNAVEATCITDGYTGDKHCKWCDVLVEQGEVIAKKGHDIDRTQGTITLEPTTTAEGTMEYPCKNCDYKETETIPKVGADFFAEEGIPEETVAVTDETILGMKDDGDVKGSSFVMIQARADKNTKNSVRLKWSKVKNADGYKIYGNKCGKKNRMKLLKTIENGKTTTYTQKKLKKGTYYKYIVRAYKLIDGKQVTIAVSKTIHSTTKGGKYGVAKSVKIKTDKKMKSKKGSYTLTIKKNKKYTIKASEVKESKKIQKHRKIAYESSDKTIATVSKKGVVKGIKKGTCYIYAYAQNGVYKKIKVKVK